MTHADRATGGRRVGRRDAVGLLGVVLGVAALIAYRKSFVEPRAWGAICAVATPPLVCAPRAALIWLQNRYLWGAAALALGLWALRGAPFWVGVAAVATGAAAVINYNASWGMIGAALGVWAWVLPARVSEAAAGNDGSARDKR